MQVVGCSWRTLSTTLYFDVQMYLADPFFFNNYFTTYLPTKQKTCVKLKSQNEEVMWAFKSYQILCNLSW